jgi:hypothetical protein
MVYEILKYLFSPKGVFNASDDGKSDNYVRFILTSHLAISGGAMIGIIKSLEALINS